MENGNTFVNNFKKTSENNLVSGLVTIVVYLVVKVHFPTKIERILIYLYLQSLKEDLRKKWLRVCKHICRKGGADSFDVKNSNKIIHVCEYHFKDEDLTTTLGRAKEERESSFNIQRATSKAKIFKTTTKESTYFIF